MPPFHLIKISRNIIQPLTTSIVSENPWPLHELICSEENVYYHWWQLEYEGC